MNQEEEFQRYAAMVDYYKSQLESIENQNNYLQAAIMDYQKAKLTVKKLAETKSGKEILVPIGGGVYTYATSKKTSKVLTDIGSGIVIEKKPDDAVAVIDKRIKGLQENKESLTSMSEQIQDQMKEISRKAQAIYEQSMQK
ncbi:MAG: prefoldin subunit alpha [Candidatus Thermoplasmatota archaeon]|nr:prefoldin subunit alpha [Candidatus Thermoplasmatota archaeon]